MQFYTFKSCLPDQFIPLNCRDRFFRQRRREALGEDDFAPSSAFRQGQVAFSCGPRLRRSASLSVSARGKFDMETHDQPLKGRLLVSRSLHAIAFRDMASEVREQHASRRRIFKPLEAHGENLPAFPTQSPDSDDVLGLLI